MTPHLPIPQPPPTEPPPVLSYHVEDSQHLLRHADPHWVAQLARGAAVLAIFMPLHLAGYALFLAMMDLGITVVLALLLFPTLIGLFLFTTRDPIPAREAAYVGQRQSTRFSGTLALILIPVILIEPWNHNAGCIAAIAVLLALISSIFVPDYLRHLARRAARPQLAQTAGILFWAYAASVAVLTIGSLLSHDRVSSSTRLLFAILFLTLAIYLEVILIALTRALHKEAALARRHQEAEVARIHPATGHDRPAQPYAPHAAEPETPCHEHREDE